MVLLVIKHSNAEFLPLKISLSCHVIDLIIRVLEIVYLNVAITCDFHLRRG